MPPSLEQRFHDEFRRFVLDRRDEAAPQFQAMMQALAHGHAKYGGKVLRTFFHPYVVAAGTLDAMAAASEAVTAILEKTARLYHADASVRAQFPVDPRVEALIRDAPLPARAVPIVRFDSFESSDGVRFLEVNTDGSSGMNDTNEIESRFLECPLVRELDRRFPLTQLPMLPRVLETLLESHAAWRDRRGVKDSDRPPRIGIVDWKGVKTEEEFFALEEVFEAAGVDTVVVDPREVRFDGKALLAEGKPIDIVYKRVLTAELLARWDEVQPLFEGYRRDAFCQVGPYLGEIVYDKGVLAFLSDPANAAHFTAEELAVLHRHVPWTRRLRAGLVEYEGERRELFDLLTARRDRFVVKPATAYGGIGVRLGAECTPAEWAEALASARETSSIVQEAVEIPEERFVQIETGTVAAKKVNVGQFVFGGRFGGLYCRVSDASVINVSSGGATLPCFRVGETPAVP